ncbi:LacI family DNA-binding transcriptional regulator [Paenibacillus humicola]|uniref:LacI family DNA-binding transcriptional regulator n=1 Tax=Paenibacillus humicola TaxID=3110540 RepID=UPI00237A8485|nr:LacI family DNA-binding transcriptional regulator [Paenibacillus humicola]
MPKLKDVAEKAGLSVTTVSRVLNNRGYISRETRDKVYRVMKELNYQPNEMARALFRKKSNMIGLIIPAVSHPFFGELAYQLEYYADQCGYKLLLCNSNRDIAKEHKYIDMLKKNQVDAIIMGSSVLNVEHYLHLELPIVSFDRSIAGNIPIVTSDNLLGGKLATQLLLDKGCRKPVFVYRGVGGPHHQALLANGRAQGYEAVMKAAGIEPDLLQLKASAEDDSEEIPEMIHFFQQRPEVDGVFASSDLVAAEVIQACSRLRKRIPDDMKIVGYDDVRIASLLSPQLSTVRQPIREMCECTLQLVAKLLEEEEVPKINTFPVTLIERETT